MKEKDLSITEAELEILGVLWDRKQATVREVHEALSALRTTGYTTTLKRLQNMLEKGLVKRDEGQRQQVYLPALERTKVQRHFTDKLMRNVFGGSAAGQTLPRGAGRKIQVAARQAHRRRSGMVSTEQLVRELRSSLSAVFERPGAVVEIAETRWQNRRKYGVPNRRRMQAHRSPLFSSFGVKGAAACYHHINFRFPSNLWAPGSCITGEIL